MPEELHPEEMLDALRAGTLSPRMAGDLQAHLQRCAACRLHLQLAQDFSGAGRGRGHGSSNVGNAALVSRMVGAVLADPGVAAGTTTSSVGFRGPSFLQRMILPVVCVLLGGGAATAMWSVGAKRGASPEIELLPTPGEPRASAGRRRTNPPAPPAPTPAAPVEATLVEPTDEPGAALRGSRPLASAARAPARAIQDRSPARLFAEANRARRAGDYATALAGYRQLRKQFPDSREEITARVIVGRLVLAEGRPAEGLAEFDSYLRAHPRGTLAEEARVGRASALMTLRRPDDERRAWSELLQHHPRSMHTDRARARLEQLRP